MELNRILCVVDCCVCYFVSFFFFFQAEDGIRDLYVTGVQTCALPIFSGPSTSAATSSAPSAARARALSEFTSRVKARAVKGPALSLMMARTSPPPWAPVAPTTAMIFFSGIAISPLSGFLVGDASSHAGRSLETGG